VLVVSEALLPALTQQLVERLLTRMAEGRVTEIVAETDRLDEILVQLQSPGDAARDARRLERVRETGAEMVAFGVDEDLRLVAKTAKCLRVGNAVPRLSYERTACGDSQRSSCSRTRLSKASATRPASSGIPRPA
jgi:hypothetical protein